MFYFLCTHLVRCARDSQTKVLFISSLRLTIQGIPAILEKKPAVIL